MFLQARFDSDEVKDCLSFYRLVFFDDRSTAQELFFNGNMINSDMQFSWFKPRKNNYPPFSIENELKVLRRLKTLLDT